MLAAELVLGRVGVVDVVGRIAERHVRELAAEHPLDVGQHRGVAAQQAVVAQDPEVARLADRLLRRLRDLVLGLIARRLAVGERQQPLQLGGVEADQVEVEALVPQPRQLLRQQRVVPAGLQGELVVGDQVRPLLRLAEVLEPDHRHLGEPELARREQPAVAGEDAALLVDQDRVGPAELDHRGRDLIDLRLAVRARVALVRAQAVDRPQLDPVGERDQPGALRCVGQRANLWCDGGANLVRRPSQASQLRTSGLLRLSAAIKCDGWCEPRVRRVRRLVRTRRSQRPGIPRLSADRANLSATGATAGSHPADSKLQEFCGFQAVSATGRCELRTRNCGLSLAKYRACAPPYQYSPRKDPDVLNVKSIYVSDFTSVSGDFICVLLTSTEHHRCATGHLLATIKAPPRNRNSPPEDWAGCRAHSASLARPYML